MAGSPRLERATAQVTPPPAPAHPRWRPRRRRRLPWQRAAAARRRGRLRRFHCPPHAGPRWQWAASTVHGQAPGAAQAPVAWRTDSTRLLLVLVMQLLLFAKQGFRAAASDGQAGKSSRFHDPLDFFPVSPFNLFSRSIDFFQVHPLQREPGPIGLRCQDRMFLVTREPPGPPAMHITHPKGTTRTVRFVSQNHQNSFWCHYGACGRVTG